MSQILKSTLDGFEKIPIVADPTTGTNAVINSKTIARFSYQDDYNASTNSPDLTGPGVTGLGSGMMYRVSVGGSFNSVELEAEELLVSKVTTPTGPSDWFIINTKKELNASIFGSGTTVSVGDGTEGIVIPPSMNGMALEDVVVAVHTKGITGTTEVQVRKRRAGVDSDMLSTKVTLGDEFFANDGTPNVATKYVSTGDVIYPDVDLVHSGTAPLGLDITYVFSKLA